MNILIYFPYNLRTVEQQSVMEMLVQKGHKVVLLTTCKRGYLHEYVEKTGVTTEAVELEEETGKISFYRTNIKKLREVLKKYNTDVVIAHQQVPALIAGALRKFKRFKLAYVRHNADEDYQINPRKAKWFNKIINWLTPVKIAPSSIVQKFWIEKEKVSPSQVQRIDYGYNFNQYEKVNDQEVKNIKENFPAGLRILSMARLVSSKRHKEMFAVLERLVREGFDCKLICLGSGPLETELRTIISRSGMENHIFLLGRKENIFDYITASDVFFHLSSTEASNSAVKEVGLCRKPVIVCKGVGDFDEYIINNKNGFLVDKDHPEEEAFSVLKAISNGDIDKEAIGNKFYETVTTSFDINNIADKYEELLNGLMKN